MASDFLKPFEEHVSSVYGYLAYRLGSRTAAESLTEATVDRAFRDRNWPSFDSGQARIFLLRVAREAASDHGVPSGAVGNDLDITPDLAEALEQLGREERSVLALRYGAGLRPREIAAVLDLSENGARRALSRGLRRVRTELERRERTHAAGSDRGSVSAGLTGRHQQRDRDEQDEARRQRESGP
jgi:RNA polymerase sigma-70 factor (ECF subfamily)